jgi:DNA-binding LacI/PurR family transcriptional regulator
MRQERVTRAEVARRAGVSKTAVTYALAGRPGSHLSAATVSRVRSTAQALGYQPHFAARSLARGATCIVGILLPSQEMQFQLYYSRMIAGIAASAELSPYNFLYLGQDQPPKYRRCLEQGWLDGVIVIQSRTDASHVQAVARSGLPAVTVNYLNRSGLPSVSADYEGSVVDAHRLLRERGCRRIAFFCTRGDCQPNHRLVAAAASLPAPGLLHVDLDRYPGVAAAWAAEVAGREVDGFIVDGVAAGIEVLRLSRPGARVRVAERSRVVIFRTTENESATPPGAMLLHAPAEAVGAAAWQSMEKILAGSDVERTTLVPFTPSSQGGLP